MFDKMKQMMEFKKRAEEIKKELEASVVEVDEGKGIKISISGTQDFRRLEIDASRLKVNEKQNLEKDLLGLLNTAVRKSQELATKKMSSVIPRV